MGAVDDLIYTYCRVFQFVVGQVLLFHILFFPIRPANVFRCYSSFSQYLVRRSESQELVHDHSIR